MEITKEMNKLLKEGILMQVGYKDGEPVYKLSPKGEQEAERLIAKLKEPK